MKCTINLEFRIPPDIACDVSTDKNSPSLTFMLALPAVREHAAQQARRWHSYLLVCLHLASHYPEGIVGGVVIDLDSAEGLGSSTSREPLLSAVIVDHHSGPSLANTGLTGTGHKITSIEC